MNLYKTNPNSIVFQDFNSDWVLRITADRRIEVNEGVEVTEAAQKALDAMQQLLTKGLDKAVADEREACANTAGLALPGAGKALRDRGFKGMPARRTHD